MLFGGTLSEAKVSVNIYPHYALCDCNRRRNARYDFESKGLMKRLIMYVMLCFGSLEFIAHTRESLITCEVILIFCSVVILERRKVNCCRMCTRYYLLYMLFIMSSVDSSRNIHEWKGKQRSGFNCLSDKVAYVRNSEVNVICL